MSKGSANQSWLDGLLSTADLAIAFEVTVMTIHNWRFTLDLPCVEVPGATRTSVRYEADVVTQWAMDNGKTIKGRLLSLSVERARAAARTRTLQGNRDARQRRASIQR